MPLGLTNSPVATVARLNTLHGPSSTVATACAAGTDAIGLAVALIRAGKADVMLAGGAEAPVSPLIVAAYRQLGALSTTERTPTEASRPFDRGRDGFVIGEGAGILVLEDRERALARGARILAEVAGYASTCDGGHLTQPDPSGEGPAAAMRLALEDAGSGPRRSGTSTRTPPRRLSATWPKHARSPPRAWPMRPSHQRKPFMGHTLGAAGGIEAVAALMAPVRDRVPPSWRHRRPRA